MIIRVPSQTAVPLESAVWRLMRLLSARHLDADAAAAVADAEPALIRSGVGWVTKQVAIEVASPDYRADRVLIPMRWVATGAAGDVFPTLDANFELRRAKPGRTDIVLIGSYQPPFGRVGAVVDHVLMHRLAELSLDRFVSRVAAALEATPLADGESEGGRTPWLRVSESEA